ncbi:Mth938-like domain-containing protein [Stenotrophomonas sp. YIM B06876]|uniref:Mth938-like domain-containing protein n=1 Tax=Stenotrophomonas sp. YIM B06876 TaxID=3060211 RepID=UPI002739377B|nr:Mth938-like domain-containing protein [Stenotrophomonas sp. YIM B06876]
MKFQPERIDAQSITGYGPGWISVGAEKISTSIILGARGLRLDWPCAQFEDLTPEHFAQLAQFDAEVVLFGSGSRNRFAPPAWLQPLMAKRVGVETMDTQAACRTYNILAGEGRNVVAALLLEPPPL